MTGQGGDLGAAHAALAQRDWGLAHELAAAAAATPGLEPRLEGDWLDVRAEAAWWLGRLDECITARERAFACYDAAGEAQRAGQCAIWLYTHHSFKGRRAIASGWLGRARRALDGDRDCEAYGSLLLYEAEIAHGAGELDRAALLSQQVIQLGHEQRAPDLEAQGLQAYGRLLIDQGRTAEGLSHLDEAMLFGLEDRLSPYVTGKVYCSMVSACHDLGDIRRAAEWTEAVSTWAEDHPVTIFPGLCRLHRADLLKWQGDWATAEAEAIRAGEELEGLFVANAGAAFAEVGEIRRRIGDLAGAEEAFARAEGLAARPAAGVALLRLAQGRVDVADRLIEAALEERSQSRLARAWLLPAAVQIAVAAEDVDRARARSEELTATAQEFESPVLGAAAATAAGRVALAAGEEAACATLRDAVARWLELDVPYEAATARVLLGQACAERGDHEGAALALAAAEATLERLGATPDLERARRLRGQRTLPCGLSEREAEVLRLVAAGLTNKQIAASLVLSDKTVARHLSNIFAKVGVSSRVAAAAFAYDNHLTAP